MDTPVTLLQADWVLVILPTIKSQRNVNCILKVKGAYLEPEDVMLPYLHGHTVGPLDVPIKFW